MFCQKCGTNLNENGVCPNCKEIYGQTQATRTARAVHRENVVIEENTRYEATTINDMACFGWQLKNNQEVVDTFTRSNVATRDAGRYIKLTFERDTGMAHFSEIDALYRDYSVLREKRFKLLKSRKARTICAVILGVLLALLWFISASDFMIYAAVYSPLFACVGGLLGYYAVGAIVSKIHFKSNILPKIKKIDNKIAEICREALKYEI